MKKWKRKKSELVFENRFFRLRKDTLELPTKEIIEWFYCDSPDSAMVLGMTVGRKLVMVRQYRYFADSDTTEVPAGFLENKENMEEAAMREFEEETGFKFHSLIKLGAFHETFSKLRRQIHIFFAPNVTKSVQNPDRGERGFEDIRVELVDFKKAVNMALENKIMDSASGLAIMLLKEKIERGEIAI